MKKKLFTGILALTLSTNMLVPSITAFASQNPIAVTQNNQTGIEGNSSISQIQESINFSNEEFVNNQNNNIEPRGFNWAKTAIRVANWIKGASLKIKKWVSHAGTVIALKDTLKVCYDWLRPVTVKKEYVGYGYHTSGDPVKTVQKALNERGFNAGTEDGRFGPNTKNAIIRFQKSKGLPADGIVGPQTWRVLLEK